MRKIMHEKISRILETEKVNKTGILDLSNCEIVSIAKEVPNLLEFNWLYQLNLSNNKIINIECIPESVKWLYIHKNEISEIKNIPNKTQTLIISHNFISKIENLPNNIKNLSLFDNNIRKIEKIPNGVELINLSKNNIRKINKLPINAQFINLSYNKIVQLENIPLDTQIIDLSHNQISEIKNIPNNIQSFDLSNNRISEIKNIPNNIQSFDLSNNEINEIYELIPFLQIGFELVYSFENVNVTENCIKIKNNPIHIPPKEYLNQGTEAVLNYFSQLELQGGEYLYEAKLLIVGDGAVGKTSLALKLMDRKNELSKNDTKGIDIYNLKFKTINSGDFIINIWDFGGQEIYKATHQFFLTNSSLYVLVDDTRKNDKAFNEISFSYWLETVKIFGNDSPLLIVQNEKFDRSKAIDFKSFKNRFSFIKGEVYKVNLESNRGLDKLEYDLFHYIQKLPHVGKLFPSKWLSIRNELVEISKKKPYITIDEYYIIYNKYLILNKKLAFELSKYLHDLGTVLHYQNDIILHKIIILQNEWATNAVYKVLDDENIKNNHGHFTIQNLKSIWKGEKFQDMVCELLSLMIKFELCYEIPDKKGNYLIPQLLPVEEPESINWNNENNIQLIYKYEFMPKGIMNSIIVRLHTNIENIDFAWTKGVVLETKNSKALIKQISNDEIVIRINGNQKNDFRTIIIDTIDKINKKFKNINVIKKVPCICNVCIELDTPHFYKYELLKELMAYSQEEIRCDNKPFYSVDINNILEPTNLNILATEFTERYSINIETQSNMTNIKGKNKVEETTNSIPYSIYDEQEKMEVVNKLKKIDKRNNDLINKIVTSKMKVRKVYGVFFIILAILLMSPIILIFFYKGNNWNFMTNLVNEINLLDDFRKNTSYILLTIFIGFIEFVIVKKILKIFNKDNENEYVQKLKNNLITSKS
ncbi:COR domain-containing protein [Flavivirga spongiicola]|uniref:non-specific serine/threonine protein kinase n=1 Tax=Flavivirga spongiicola TaxID=421621 RepID=A0ABU7XYQ0_9FLAO|nr:COR domain-containing protein [Flavivirga sp. MEBiC05379]MDO5980565.1 COR domain-containing protein [Flavivirga sp. MEBiC05379]